MTDSSRSQQLPLAYTMAAVATGVNLNTTGVVNPQSAITAVEAPAPQVVGSLLLLGEFASPVDNQNTSGTDPIHACQKKKILPVVSTRSFSCRQQSVMRKL